MVNWKRKFVQFTSLILMNPYWQGFTQGRIYRGVSKYICVPGLNCYSCPAAIGACPLGALQSILASGQYLFSYYVTGTLMVFGVALGRFICGWLCPFGLIQDLLNKIPSPIIKVSRRLNYCRYVFLVVFVIILPILAVNALNIGDPAFCKYICPAGTLEGAVPLLLINSDLRAAAGALFILKTTILVLVIILSILIFRPFCRFVCPLGAIYGLFNPISIYRYQVNQEKCIQCRTCVQTCQVGLEAYKEINSPECIRCGACIKACPTQAIKSTVSGR